MISTLRAVSEAATKDTSIWPELSSQVLLIVLGAVVGFVVALVTSLIRDKREDRVRWHDTVRIECVKLMGLANEASQLSNEMVDVRQVIDSGTATMEVLTEALESKERAIQLLKDLIYTKGAIAVVAPLIVAQEAIRLADMAGKLLGALTPEDKDAFGTQMDEFINVSREALGARNN